MFYIYVYMFILITYIEENYDQLKKADESAVSVI